MSSCISLIVKTNTLNQIDEWIKNRETVLSEVDGNSKYAEVNRELIKNLKASREAIEKIETCETRD